MNKIIALLITLFVAPLILVILFLSFPYIVYYSYSVYEYIHKDGFRMQQSETKESKKFSVQFGSAKNLYLTLLTRCVNIFL